MGIIEIIPANDIILCVILYFVKKVINMRGTHTYINDLRRNVFKEIAKFAYNGGGFRELADIPFKIVPGEVGEHRQSIFLERAIVSERLRLALGLPLRSVKEHEPLSLGMDDINLGERHFDLPLVNIIPFACNACPTKRVMVTDACQGCLGHPCSEVCPKGAVEIKNGKSYIREDKCIKCGKCIEQCAYNAIIKIERPCAAACGMDAIESDEFGRAKINYDKCVSCGMCLVNCPFSAIVDKSQIYQLIYSIKKGEKVTAAIAPSFVGQFGKECTPKKLISALKLLGFDAVCDVSIGADLCTIEEAFDFIEKVPSQQPFMATSCCPSWSMMAKKLYPQFSSYISMAMTPMVLTAKLVKKDHPDQKVCFIGPCAAKKNEALVPENRDVVDFVLTFEELQGMFDAMNINFADVEESDEDVFIGATAAARGFAVSGGVAGAVSQALTEIAPGSEILTDYAEGLRECRKMLMLAKAGKRNGYLLEGMGCPGGCVSGAGTVMPSSDTAKNVAKFQSDAASFSSMHSQFADRLEELMD